MVLKLLQGVYLLLHFGVKGHKKVFPQLVEETVVFSCLEVTFDQEWIVAYEHVHEAPRPGMGLGYGHTIHRSFLIAMNVHLLC